MVSSHLGESTEHLVQLLLSESGKENERVRFADTQLGRREEGRKDSPLTQLSSTTVVLSEEVDDGVDLFDARKEEETSASRRRESKTRKDGEREFRKIAYDQDPVLAIISESQGELIDHLELLFFRRSREC